MRLRKRVVLNFSFVILNCFCALAQKPVGIAYYDLDHLYDTIPALFYNDTKYTPEGKYHWNTERYDHRIRNTAAVIDSMALPIIALCEVENEEVVRDIVRTSKGDYTYLHRTLNSLDGMDFALLYYGDMFIPDYDEPGRNYLYVEGELRMLKDQRALRRSTTLTYRYERIGLLLVRDTRMAEWVVRDLREERPGVKIVVLGRSWSVDCAKYGLQDATLRAEQAGRGNVRSRRGWMMRDRILADTALTVCDADVFARRYLLDPKNGYPYPTFEKEHYKGGYSYALPIFVYIR